MAPENLVRGLRYLNEETAGDTGFLRVSEDGSGFVRGDGAPTRFWCAQTNVAVFRDPEEGARHARWLARLGVNLVRLGGATRNPKHAGSSPEEIDEERLDATWRAVAALKRQGIYSLLMPYWVARGSDLTAWGIEGYSGPRGGDLNQWGSGGADSLWGLLFFNARLQAAYRGWLRQLLIRPNPYTGISLAQDPAVGIILLQNEDSLLYCTVSKIAPPQQRKLGALFGRWALARYGSLERASAAWGQAAVEEDDPEQGVLALYPIYEATVDQTGGKAARVEDQVQFLTDTMRTFNLAMLR